MYNLRYQDELLYFTSGRDIFKHNTQTKSTELITFDFHPGFSDDYYTITDFNICPYDANKLVIYLQMFSNQFERRGQIAIYDTRSGIGEFIDFEKFGLEPEKSDNFYKPEWLEESTPTDNKILFTSQGDSTYTVLHIDKFEHEFIWMYYQISEPDFSLVSKRNKDLSWKGLFVNDVQLVHDLPETKVFTSVNPSRDLLLHYKAGKDSPRGYLFELHDLNGNTATHWKTIPLDRREILLS